MDIINLLPSKSQEIQAKKKEILAQLHKQKQNKETAKHSETVLRLPTKSETVEKIEIKPDSVKNGKTEQEPRTVENNKRKTTKRAKSERPRKPKEPRKIKRNTAKRSSIGENEEPRAVKINREKPKQPKQPKTTTGTRKKRQLTPKESQAAALWTIAKNIKKNPKLVKEEINRQNKERAAVNDFKEFGKISRELPAVKISNNPREFERITTGNRWTVLDNSVDMLNGLLLEKLAKERINQNRQPWEISQEIKNAEPSRKLAEEFAQIHGRPRVWNIRTDKERFNR